MSTQSKTEKSFRQKTEALVVEVDLAVTEARSQGYSLGFEAGQAAKVESEELRLIEALRDILHRRDVLKVPMEDPLEELAKAAGVRL